MRKVREGLNHTAQCWCPQPLQPLQLPLQLWPLPLLFGLDDPPATLCAHVDMRFFTLRLLQRGQATFSADAPRISFSKDTPQLLQSYSKIGICNSPMLF